MPQRPEQHRTASRAVAAVRKIWADEGAAVDEIGEDYGEDLLVQPCLNGRMDKSRLWIQVKGTAAAMRLEKAKAPFMSGFVEVDRDLAMRWLGSADLVVVVRWSVVHQVGWYVIPKLTLGALDFWDENDEPKARVRLRLRLDNPFDAAAARKLAWIARLDNAAAGLRGAPVAGSGRRFLKTGVGRLDYDVIEDRKIDPGGFERREDRFPSGRVPQNGINDHHRPPRGEVD